MKTQAETTIQDLSLEVFPTRYIQWGIYLMVFLIPFQLHLPGASWFISVCVVISAILFVPSLVNAAASGRIARLPSHILVAALLLVLTLSLINSDKPYLSFESQLAGLVLLLTFYFNITWNIRRWTEVKGLVVAFLGGSAAIAGFSLIDSLIDHGLYYYLRSHDLLKFLMANPQYRALPAPEAIGTFYNATYLGSFLMFPSSIAFALSLWGRGKLRVMGALLFPLMAVTVLFTRGRGALLALVSALAILGIAYMLSHRRQIMPIALVLLFLAALAFLLLLPLSESLYQGIAQAAGTEERWTTGSIEFTYGRRLRLFSAGVETWREAPSPWLGHGYEQSIKGFSIIYPVGYKGVVSPGHSHNWYLQMLITSGVIGLVATLAILAIALRGSLKAYLRSKEPWLKGIAIGIFAALLAFLVDGIFNHSYREPKIAITFWIFVALGVLLPRLSRSDSIEDVSRVSPRIGLPPIVAIGATIAFALLIGYTAAYLGEISQVYVILAGLAILAIGAMALAGALSRR